jgi:hypothetical protein
MTITKDWQTLPQDVPMLCVEHQLIAFLWKNDEDGFLAAVEDVKHLVHRFPGRLMDWMCFMTSVTVEGLNFDEARSNRLIRHMLQLGCPPHNGAVLDAIRWRHDMQLAEAFLAAGARIAPGVWFELLVPHLDVVRWLISKGCDPMVKNDKGRTPLEEWKHRLADPSFTFYLDKKGRSEMEASITFLDTYLLKQSTL